MRTRPLNVEQRDDLRDLLFHPGIQGYYATIEALVEAEEKRVLRYTLEDERELVRLKLRAEGARALFEAIKRQTETLKAKQKAKA
jgi:hypothetical protein